MLINTTRPVVACPFFCLLLLFFFSIYRRRCCHCCCYCFFFGAAVLLGYIYTSLCMRVYTYRVHILGQQLLQLPPPLGGRGGGRRQPEGRPRGLPLRPRRRRRPADPPAAPRAPEPAVGGGGARGERHGGGGRAALSPPQGPLFCFLFCVVIFIACLSRHMYCCMKNARSLCAVPHAHILISTSVLFPLVLSLSFSTLPLMINSPPWGAWPPSPPLIP
jgi:hypothetical protein